MMSTAVLPGRFQPFHNGHAACLEHALTQFDRVVVAISNAHISHVERDPFTGGERFEMIDEFARAHRLTARVLVLPVPIDDQPTTWAATIRATAPAFTHVYTRSAWTATLFEYWGIPNAPELLTGHDTNASLVRATMTQGDAWEALVPASTVAVIRRCGGVDRVRSLTDGQNQRLSTPTPATNEQENPE